MSLKSITTTRMRWCVTVRGTFRHLLLPQPLPPPTGATATTLTSLLIRRIIDSTALHYGISNQTISIQCIGFIISSFGSISRNGTLIKASEFQTCLCSSVYSICRCRAECHKSKAYYLFIYLLRFASRFWAASLFPRRNWA